MKIINNITEKLSDELKQDLRVGGRLSIAAACFSVYAFEELKTQLLQIDARVLFLCLRPFWQSSQSRNRESFISHGATEKRRCTAASLKFACAMRLRSALPAIRYSAAWQEPSLHLVPGCIKPISTK